MTDQNRLQVNSRRAADRELGAGLLVQGAEFGAGLLVQGAELGAGLLVQGAEFGAGLLVQGAEFGAGLLVPERLHTLAANNVIPPTMRPQTLDRSAHCPKKTGALDTSFVVYRQCLAGSCRDVLKEGGRGIARPSFSEVSDSLVQWDLPGQIELTAIN